MRCGEPLNAERRAARAANATCLAADCHISDQVTGQGLVRNVREAAGHRVLGERLLLAGFARSRLGIVGRLLGESASWLTRAC